MTLRPCAAIRMDGICGKTPAVKICAPHQLRVECECGAHGVAISYGILEEMRAAAQAAIDGWNLGG